MNCFSRWLCVGGVLVSAFVLSACEDSKKDAAATPASPVVLVAPVRQENIPITKEWVGTLDGYQNAQIRARVQGYLLTQNYVEGSLVKKDSVLFTIDPRPFQATLEQAQATLAQVQAKAQLAQITLDRQTQLYETKVISAQEFDTATQDAKAQIAAAAAAQADVVAAQVNLGYCTILAPFDGIAGKAQAQIGDLVGGENAVLTQMSQVDPIKVYFSITEQEYLQAATKLQAVAAKAASDRNAVLQLKLANGSIYPEKGTFDFANRQVNDQTGTIQIAGIFPNPNNILRPGQFARVRATVDEIKDALVVPQSALIEVQGTFQVMVLNSDAIVQGVPVQIGPAAAPMQVITRGLKVGDVIVVQGTEKVRSGMKVTPQSASPTSSPSQP